MEGSILADRYQLVEVLGRGGMGTVYRARDLRTGGTVAVKILNLALGHDPAYIERLRREARIAAALHSPRIVRVTDLDEHAGTPFLVMEYVPGETLAALLQRHGPLSVPAALTIALEVARALEAAHTAGIVHRDLKPQNIALVDGQVKVLDFGIARAEGDAALTATSIYMGTPEYSAPERAAGMGDIRADIYALGAVLFALLAGASPFRGPTPVAVLMQHATAPLPEMPDDVPLVVRRLIGRCLAKSPGDRYQTPAELAAALTIALRSIAEGPADLRTLAVPAPADTRDALPMTLPLGLSTGARDAAPVSQAPTGASDEAPTAARTGRSGRSPTPSDAAARLQRRQRRWLVASVPATAILVVAMILAVLGARGRGGRAAPAPAPATAGASQAVPPGRPPAGAGPPQAAVEAGGVTVESAGTITAGGPAVALANTTPGRPARLAFEGRAGQWLSVGLLEVQTGPANCCVDLAIYAPDGRQLAYATETARVTAVLSEDLAGTLRVGGSPEAVELARAGQRARLTFEGVAGQRLSLRVDGVTGSSASCCLRVSIDTLEGQELAFNDSAGAEGATVRAGPLPATGTYSVVVRADSGLKTSRFTLTLTSGS